MRIERLEIDDLRSIKKLRWPEDGLGWGGRIPDVVVVAGANGSGKTTLLNEIYSNLIHIPYNDNFFIINEKLTLNYEEGTIEKNGNTINLKFKTRTKISYTTKTKIIYFKSTRGIPDFSKNSSKKIESMPEPSSHHYIWDNTGSNDISIEQLCYSARWEDANNFLNGRPEKATKFKFYADEFERFTEGEKRLVWSDEGELLVETRDGVRHDVNEMSSGEHQALIFSIMLSRWWAPGSIILIDEPELHLHTHWQAKLLQRIIDLQKERGGQAILATQSSDLFSMAPAGSQVLLGGW